MGNFFAAELVVRPIVKDIASSVDQRLAHPAGLRVRTGRKLFLALVAFGFIIPVLVIGLRAHRGAGIGALAGDLGTAALIALTLALALELLLTEAFVAPLHDLVQGTREVAAGNFDWRVPEASHDEFGLLARSFNTMVEGLARDAELRASRARIAAAADAERRRTERELHAGAQQQLVLIKLRLDQLRHVSDDDPARVELVAQIQDDLAAAMREMADLAHGIYPALLDHDGLAAALREAVERSAVPATLRCDLERRHPRELESAVYFCCLEALDNLAGAASGGTRAHVQVRERDGVVEFEVSGDGAGGGAGQAPGGSIQRMTDRIAALGGTLHAGAAGVKGEVPTSRE
jgi:nitrate/nitrite-specific signal transduction histidine kinase